MESSSFKETLPAGVAAAGRVCPGGLSKYRWLAIPAVFFLLLIALSGSAILAKEMITVLLLPPGLVWMVMVFAIFWPSFDCRSRCGFGIIWVIYSVAGCPLVGNRLLAPMEKPYQPYARVLAPLDVVLVLGGGTELNLDGDSQLGSLGDRVAHAARLYQRGLVGKLVTSGSAASFRGDARDLSSETAAIWTDWQIPAEDILCIPEPRNTEEEIRKFREILASLNPPPRRVGICTSAWHMKRAQAIWEKEGFDWIPVPCNFLSRKLPLTTYYLLPSCNGFFDVHRALRERMGLLKFRINR